MEIKGECIDGVEICSCLLGLFAATTALLAPKSAPQKVK